MKPLILFAIILFHINLCFAQNLNSGGPSKTGFYQEIPFEQINGKIIIEVNIAGRSHKFLLDTGAPFTINNEIAAQLNIMLPKENNIKDAYNNVSTIKLATVDSINLGSIAFKNIPVLVGSNSIYKCLGVEGNIGSNLLRNTIIKFDSNHKIIIITDEPEKLNLNNKSSIKMSIDKDKQSTPFLYSI